MNGWKDFKTVDKKFTDNNEVTEAVQGWLKATPNYYYYYYCMYKYHPLQKASGRLWAGGPSVLRSRWTISKNKTQTISIRALVKTLL
jgi:hypothetical protein